MLSYRNSFCPANRVPVEILHIIFCLATQETFPTKQGRVPTNFAISYVGSHWRAASLSCAEMWSYIDVYSFRLVNMLVKRSEPWPICLSVPDDGTYFSATRQCMRDPVFAGALQRTRSIRYSVRRIDVPTWIENNPAPLLEEVLFVRDEGTQMGEYMRAGGLFAGSAPKLRRLELRNCSLPWRAGLFGELTSLSIDTPFSPVMTAQGVVAVLRTSPRLEDLRLAVEGPVVARNITALNVVVSPIYPQVTLHSLRQLTLSLPLTLLGSVFVSIVLPVNPPPASVLLECVDYPAVLLFRHNYLRSYFNDHVCPNATSLEFFYSASGSGLTVSSRNRRKQESHLEVKSSGCPTSRGRTGVVIPGLCDGSEFTKLIAIITGMPCPQLKEVAIKGEASLSAMPTFRVTPASSPLRLVEALNKFSEVRTITIGGNLLSSSASLELYGWCRLRKLESIIITDWCCTNRSEIHFLRGFLTRLTAPLKTFTLLRCTFAAEHPWVDSFPAPFNLVDLSIRYGDLFGLLHISYCTIRVPSQSFAARLVEDVRRINKSDVYWLGTQFVVDEDMMDVTDY